MRRRHHATTLVILAAATACGGGDLDEGPIGSVEQPVTVCPGATVVEGIDVSHWDGVIDWGKVAGAGKKFSVAKATQSTDFIDDKFVANWKGMKAAGVIRGAYHFFDFVTNPTAQADWFVDEIEKAGGLEPGDLPPTLDLEWNGNQQSSAKKVQEFLQRVEQRTCRRPMIYTSASFLDPLSPPAALAAYPVWIAHYTNGCPNTPALWSAWTFWQNSDKGVVAGIPAAAVDLDKFDGSLADLQAFASEVTCGGAGGAGQGGGGAGGGGQGACPTWIGAAGAVLEEDGPCATLSGKVYQSTDGHAGHAYTTKADVPAPDYADGVIWNLRFSQAGTYRLRAAIPAGRPSTRTAPPESPIWAPIEVTTMHGK